MSVGTMTSPPEMAARAELMVSDPEIMERSLVDPRAFELLYSRYAAVLHRYLARRVGTALADDLTSEIFLVAFRTRQRYDPAADSALPWLYGIATNVIRRHWRTEKNHYRALERSGIDPVIADDHADAVALRVSASGASRHLAGALSRLSRKEHEVLLLVAWENLSYEQVGSALDIPVGTVRSRLSSARRRLREALPHFTFS